VAPVDDRKFENCQFSWYGRLAKFTACKLLPGRGAWHVCSQLSDLPQEYHVYFTQDGNASVFGFVFSFMERLASV